MVRDGQRVTTTFGYDDLHRVVTKTYSNDNDVTPDVTYAYHTGAPYIGQLLSVSSSAGATIYGSYDALGRVLTHSQLISGNGTYSFVYEYWLNDALKKTKYPSNREVFFDTGNAGRVTKVRAATPTSKTYVDLTAVTTPYMPDGRISQMLLGNNLWETHDYRRPGTATALKLGSSQGGNQKLELLYNYSATENNGNLLSHVIHQDSSYWSQTYTYDAFNRLSCATENLTGTPAAAGTCPTQSSWRQKYEYDRFGNRWVSEIGGFATVDSQEFTQEGKINKDNNRLTDYLYDAAGNVAGYSSWNLGYDAENRILSMTSTSLPTSGYSNFIYDGNGKRITKESTIPTPHTTYFVYDAFGKLAAEYSTQAMPAGTSYLFADLLGTPRAVTGSDGSLQECTDYTPFGRSLTGQMASRTGGCHQGATHASQQFTGQVRDEVTNLDYFGARYYSGAQGRFTSADPLYFQSSMIEDPQRFNLYSYVRNNPLRYVDPTGEKIELTGANATARKEQLDAIRAAVSAKAAALLYENLDKATGKYFVEISGSVSSFQAIDPAASSFGKIITQSEIAKFRIVPSQYETLNISWPGPKGTLRNTLAQQKAIGATGRDSGGQLWVYVLKPDSSGNYESTTPEAMGNRFFGVPAHLNPQFSKPSPRLLD